MTPEGPHAPLARPPRTGDAVDPAALRVLWVTETYPPSRGGMAQSCDRIVRGLRGAGATVDVLQLVPAVRPGQEAFRFVARSGGRDLVCPIEEDPAHALNRAWNALERDPRRHELTHVVAFGGIRPLTAAPVLAAWLGVPLVTLLRGNDFDTGVFSARRRPILDDALRRSALVATVSRDKAWRVAALHPDVPVRWIPNGIDLADWTFAPSDHARAAAWRAEHVAPGRRVIGLVGQLKPKKGGLLLLDALRRSGRHDEVHLVLAGELDAAMGDWLATHGADLAVTTLPFLDRFELLPWYAACDWVAIPSFYDGLPNVLIEAAALGVPMIAADVAGMADVLVDGESAVLFPPGDEDACAAALRRALDLDPAPLGAAARRLAVGELDARTETRRYLEALAATAAAGLASGRPGEEQGT
ncbi:glycosyltransferase family 4 protein [Patulibacter brassicae]|uniref:Glycosyltransferase family 4 protein n=1 Tax=Patulibacter brassicae TaxID=1705717 RepID=A0ABU4VFG8_9ACTN|nr:glycosyltransferase family 4 protein [Patulibacter brassicae]MDX8150449.1 glycosyltransferase family 4 protein [Patulibacter brassicae]